MSFNMLSKIYNRKSCFLISKVLRRTCERPILYLILYSLFRLDKVTWAEATEEECEKMTKCRVSMNRLVIPIPSHVSISGLTKEAVSGSTGFTVAEII